MYIYRVISVNVCQMNISIERLSAEPLSGYLQVICSACFCSLTQSVSGERRGCAVPARFVVQQ